MPKFRKKPVVIEARQVPVGGNTTDPSLAEWCGGSASSDHVLIKTLEGTMCADVGDWIIKGVKGEFYPCKPDIFEATYEPA